MSSKYSIQNPEGIYFITFAVIEWIDIFGREEYKQMLVDSLHYCITNKGLLLHAWCIMPNHVHLIASAEAGSNLSAILRDMKKHTSKKILASLEEDTSESRRYWMLWLFKDAGKRNSNNSLYQFWQQDNHSVELVTNAMLEQRLHYLHNNPVTAGIVHEPHQYVYSSAGDYCGIPGVLPLHMLEE